MKPVADFVWEKKETLLKRNDFEAIYKLLEAFSKEQNIIDTFLPMRFAYAILIAGYTSLYLDYLKMRELFLLKKMLPEIETIQGEREIYEKIVESEINELYRRLDT